jgi:Divergent InlB B-repeat domain
MFLAMLAMAYGQTVSVTPKSPSIGLGQTIQFSAATTGLSNQDVLWYSGGSLGGNSAAGTISGSGLYTAPTTMPGQNPVSIKAVSKINSSVSATVYVSLLTAGPTLTSVTPNPLSIGTFTVTLKGSGFQPYVSVVDTYNGTPVQLSTVSITSDTIVATGYQPSAPNGTFTVRNPGSLASNAVIVPVKGGATTYTLNVNGGSGSGNYAAGTVVNVSANPPAGQTFTKWTGATVTNPLAASTTLVMPAAHTSLTANYSGGPVTYALTVVNGSGSGSYTAGTVVNISANSPPANSVFSVW